MEAICKPGDIKKKQVICLVPDFIAVITVAKDTFHFHDTSCSRITFEILTTFYLSVKLLSSIYPNRWNLSAFQKPDTEKRNLPGAKSLKQGLVL